MGYVVRYDFVRDTAVDDVSPHEAFNLVVFDVAYESASTHFEKKSVKTNRNCFCFDMCMGPTRSIDHRMNGYGAEIDERTSAG